MVGDDPDAAAADDEGPDPHADQPVVTAGAPSVAAEVAVILVHGRGATADGVVNLAESFYRHGVAFFAPQASRSRWFPYDARGEVERNEPHLSSAVDAVERALAQAGATGIPAERTVLFGFSQGAAVVTELLRRRPRRLGGVVVLSGSFVGPEDREFPEAAGSLAGTPVFVASGDADEYVPVDRVGATADLFRALDGDVTERIYEGLEHGISEAEFDVIRGLLDELLEN
ncbi:alpha/beta hydrolase [Haloarchaeobius litoreus]|uniref:Alpha/beta hydrolase n=1 Tax=Haloarchaeobius litoreus TaxID=755306 RepID=A0ABD6DE84_9EURY|nr:alpha/beta fold hydrolase [Haloarchaeobius litoreus]